MEKDLNEVYIKIKNASFDCGIPVGETDGALSKIYLRIDDHKFPGVIDNKVEITVL